MAYGLAPLCAKEEEEEEEARVGVASNSEAAPVTEGKAATIERTKVALPCIGGQAAFAAKKDHCVYLVRRA